MTKVYFRPAAGPLLSLVFGVVRIALLGMVVQGSLARITRVSTHMAFVFGVVGITLLGMVVQGSLVRITRVLSTRNIRHARETK